MLAGFYILAGSIPERSGASLKNVTPSSGKAFQGQKISSPMSELSFSLFSRILTTCHLVDFCHLDLLKLPISLALSISVKIVLLQKRVAMAAYSPVPSTDHAEYGLDEVPLKSSFDYSFEVATTILIPDSDAESDGGESGGFEVGDPKYRSSLWRRKVSVSMPLLFAGCLCVLFLLILIPVLELVLQRHATANSTITNPSVPIRTHLPSSEYIPHS